MKTSTRAWYLMDYQYMRMRYSVNAEEACRQQAISKISRAARQSFINRGVVFSGWVNEKRANRWYEMMWRKYPVRMIPSRKGAKK